MSETRDPFDAAMTTALGQRSAAPGECLSAETLAAYVDQDLAADERGRCEQHLADCARCQASLAALVRTIPSQDAVPDAGPVGDDPNEESALASMSWLIDWRWLTPMAAAAVLVITITLNNQSIIDEIAPTVDRQARLEQAQTQAQAEADRPAPLEDTAAPAASLEEAAPPAAAPAPAEVGIRERLPARAERAVSALRAPESTAVVLSPDPLRRWRVTGTRVDRTIDGGRTWFATLDIEAALLAGAAPSATVCWVVGEAGTVYLSTDGVTWNNRPGPVGDDLVAVGAVSATEAVVTTSTGARYRTTDAGATWAPE